MNISKHNLYGNLHFDSVISFAFIETCCCNYPSK